MSQHAFEAASQGNVVIIFQTSGDFLLLFIGVEASMLAVLLGNVSSVHVCGFYLGKCCSNCIVITVSKGDICKHEKSKLNVSGMFFIVSGSLLINEW